MNRTSCTRCMRGHYGQICDQKCPKTCDNLTCDKHSGACHKCINYTFYGNSCNVSCSSNCNNNECLQDSGACISGCIYDYSGLLCDLRCPGMCLRSADNTAAVCDVDGNCIGGCVKGFEGNKCDMIANASSKDNNTSDPPVAIIAGAAAGGVVLIILIVVIVVVLKIRRPKDRESPGNVYENSVFDGRAAPDTAIALADGLQTRTSDYSYLDNQSDISHTYSALATNAAAIIPDTLHTYTNLDSNAMGDKPDVSNTHT
ncbi:scavenger receptor class F member 2-like [Dreissena polymorpha]|uniref:scavenger receptor class F member 2-like n=1 Tax=Dreissena polymorpha TaxID=45954 RepID=UPI002264AACF|nr:scavenger receptor class F member 2-like [Dreissena polymorpha]